MIMLHYRLEILDPVVDYFIIVEATHTFVGKEKRLFFNEQKHLFERYSHKIIHIIVDDMPYKFPHISIENEEQWANEYFQRDCIARGISKLTLENQDLLLISDADELPDPILLHELKRVNQYIEINSLEQDFYYYNLTTKMPTKWYKARILSYKAYCSLNLPCSQIRQFEYSFIFPGGWHLSCFGNTQFIQNKLQNFSHQEYNKEEIINLHNIEEKIKSSSDIVGRDINLIKVPLLENKYLPPLYQQLMTYL